MSLPKFVGLTFVFYLALTMGTGSPTEMTDTGSGTILFWSLQELVVGILAAVVVGVAIHRSRVGEGHRALLGTVKFYTTFIWYLLWYMLKANLDVAMRVITGRVHSGIVKLETNLKTPFGVAMLANAITLTPGTLTVDVDDENNFYVHWIEVLNHYPSMTEVCGRMGELVEAME